MKKPIILSLSDFHIKNTEDSFFDNSVSNFISLISNFILENKEWKPNFISICGDIVNSGNAKEFDKSKGIIRKICDVCDVDYNNVIMAIGNHDITPHVKPIKKIKYNFISYQKERKYHKYLQLYFSNIDKLLSMSTSDKELESVIKKITPEFKNYSTFRKSFLSVEPEYYCSPLLKGSEIENLVGYRCFRNESLLFLELNNSWYSMPKDYDLVRNFQMRFGARFIIELYEKIKILKKQGYFVVSIFHIPFHRLSRSEYQPSGNNYCVYDPIVELSDICISGHEHGPETKIPDCLGNSAQYFLNGGFYSKEGSNFDCSAALLKINREENKIEKKQMSCDTRNFTWRFLNTLEVPIASTICKGDKPSKSTPKIELRIKTLTCESYLLKRKNALQQLLVSKYFGSRFELDENLKLIENKEPSDYQVCFINIQDSNNGQKNLNLDNSLTTFVLCYAQSEMGNKAESIYETLKTNHYMEILQGSAIFTLTKIEIL